MKPILLSFGNLHLHSFGLMVALGVFVAIVLMRRVAAKNSFPRDQDVFDMVFITLLTGFVGGRAAYIAEYADWYFKHPLKIFAIWEGGLIFYGGLVGAFLGLWLFSRFRRIVFLDTIDFLSPYVALTHSFGRIGCFLNGCCFGKECSLPWAVKFPYLKTAVHPTQLYETVFTFILFLFLARAYSQKHFRGEVTALYFAIYGLGRFAIEFFRAGNPMLVFLTWNQWISVGLTAIFGIFYFVWKRRGIKNAE